jgi:tetratricopeptide (TPR) repeat protein
VAAGPAYASDPPTGASLAAYVKARAADADGASDIAARGYAAALTADPGNEVIAIRAFREGLSIGDYALADRALGVLERSQVAPADTAIFRFAQRLAAKDMSGAGSAADAIAQGPLDFIGPVLRAWLALSSGTGDPAVELAAVDDNVIGRRYAAENAALIAIAQGRHADAAEQIQALLGNGHQASLDLRINAARLFAGKGQAGLARALLAGDDAVLSTQRSALGRGARGDAAFGAARLFTRLAADLAGGQTTPLTVMLTRSALLLDPEDDRARLLLADALSEDGAGARALALVDAVRPRSAFASVAQDARVTVLGRMGDGAGAIAAAAALSRAPGAGAEAAQRHADLLIGERRYDEAAEMYRVAIDRAGAGADWLLNLQLGGALEQAGRWDEALPYLIRAVELAPEQAVALNYLGYAQIERGENLAEAQALLERARRLEPNDASITDSLGWAYVQRGDIARALPLLEEAARAEPGDVVINEHLGDAYWRAGRRYEARYAWTAAAVHAEGDDAARLSGKVERGLDGTANAR